MRALFTRRDRFQFEADDALVGIERLRQRAFFPRRSAHHHGQQDAVRILDQSLPLQAETAGQRQPAQLVRVPGGAMAVAVRPISRDVQPAEITDILARLKAIDASRPVVPMPKGPVPTSMKGLRGQMRGR